MAAANLATKMISLLAALLMAAVCSHAQDGNRQEVSGNPVREQRARELWELAIAAKGGRERLYAVRNLLISIGKKHRTVKFAVFPDKFWQWADSRPSPLGLNITMYNIEKQLGYWDLGDGKPPTPRQNWKVPHGNLLWQQIMYLMETQWVKPVPYDFGEETLHGRIYDVVFTRVEGDKISYLLDKITHLPAAFRYHTLVDKKDRQGKTIATVEVDDPIEFREYTEVNGIQMPSQVSWSETLPFMPLTYQINVEYDEQLFEQPPSVAAGPDAWRKKPPPSPKPKQ